MTDITELIAGARECAADEKDVLGPDAYVLHAAGIASASYRTTQGEPSADERHLRGHWSNGDPVHIITDGESRRVAPNLNGAKWVPEGEPQAYDRYAEHDKAKRDGGYCRGCDETFAAPERVQGEPSDALSRTRLISIISGVETRDAMVIADRILAALRAAAKEGN